MTVDIKKELDSVNHSFLFLLLHTQKNGLGSEFIKWIKILIKNLESCIIKDSKTTPYVKLERGTRKGDQMSAYFFILPLEGIFALIKANPNTEGLKFIIFFNLLMLNKKSALELINTVDTFSLFSGLKINKENC